MKIVLLEEKTVTQGDISLDCFYSLGDVTGYPLTPQDKVAERVGDAEAVIINKTVFTRELMENALSSDISDFAPQATTMWILPQQMTLA